MSNSLDFSLLELCAILGLVQTVAVLVYIVSRAGHIRYIIVPFLCFITLSSCFLLDFGGRRFEDYPVFRLWHAGVWMAVPAVSVLLIHQIIDLGALPRPRAWFVLLVPVLLLLAGKIYGGTFLEETEAWSVLNVLCAGVSLFTLWIGRQNFALLREEKDAKGERYWLIISVLLINIGFMALDITYLFNAAELSTYLLARDILGVGLVYLASTSLFRIYPPAVKLKKASVDESALSNEDNNLLSEIKRLLEEDKVYQETSFSRAHLARELNSSEARVSKVVNFYFGKSLPQVINELRVRDSLQLLEQTTAAITVIAEEVGFNSLPTFNRVFKEVMGMSPSDYRQRKKSA